MLQPNEEYDSQLTGMQDTMIEATAHDWLSDGGDNFNLAILVLTSVNVSAAILTVVSIFYDAWSTKEWDFYPKTRKFFNFVPVVHPADVLPLVFSFAVILQGIVLVGISAKESNSTLSHRCSIIAQIVWPVLWIVPYTTFVFGLDISFRSLYRIKLSSHGRWHIPICVVGILLLTFATWVPSHLSPSNGLCLSSSIWWTAHYAQAGVAIIVALIATYIICATVIMVNLLKQSKMGRDERLQASVVVYYLIVTTLILSLALPFYAQIFVRKPAIHTSKLAEIALSISGIIPGVIRILLRSNANWTLIPQVKRGWFKKRPTTIFASSDLDMHNHMTSPVLQCEKANHTILKKGPEKSGKQSLEGRGSHRGTSNEHKIYARLPQISETAGVAPPPRIMLTPSAPSPRPNYSIFPTHASALTRESSSTTFSMGYEEVDPPRPVFAYGHKRINSDQTSATVEIGFRYSHTNSALHPDELSPTSTDVPFSYQATPTSAYSWDHVGGGRASQPGLFRNSSEDIAILPTQPNEPRSPSQSLGPVADLLSPGWFHCRETTLGSHPQRRDRNVMKSLPPVPQNVSGSHTSMRSAYKPSKLASKSEHNDSTEDANNGR